MASGQGIDVRPHPHINLATVTYLFAGAIDHRDSLGTRQRIEPGAVNLMTAGRGITHSERSPGDERAAGPQLSGIQTWLAMPRDKEEMPAAFEHVPEANLPIVDAGGVEVRLIMGEAYGARSPVTCHSPTLYAALMMAPGSSIEVENEADERAVYLLDGDAEIDGVALQPSHLVLLRPGYRPQAALGRRRSADDLRRSADGRRAPRLVELRLLEPRPHQRGEARLEGRGVRAAARRP